MVDSPLSASLAALSQFYVGDGTVQETLARIAELSVDAVPGAEIAGITLVVDGRQRTAVCTDPDALDVDQVQYGTGKGPCLDAFNDGQVIELEATNEPGAWPEFRGAAAAKGIGSVLSLPLIVNAKSVGALNLYACDERAFTDADREIGALFAAQAAIVVANTQAYWDAHELSVRLGDAMRNRAVIEQAKGVLMAAQGFDESAAFAMLVSASQRENVKVRDIAQRIVDNVVKRSGASDEERPDGS